MDTENKWTDPLDISIEDYHSGLYARSTFGNGTRANPIDWIDKRLVECLSQGEKMVYYYLRWDDNVIDIRAQVPMNNEIVKAIVSELNFTYSGRNLTTDFVVTYKDGRRSAYSVKNSEEDIDEENDEKGTVVRRQIIEAIYWEKQNVSWELIVKSKLNRTMVNNIRIVTRFYDPSSVWDKNSLIAYFIARKIIKVDMTQPIDFPGLVKLYLEGDGFNR